MFEGRNIIAAAGVAIAAALGISSMAQRNDAGEIMTAGSVDAFEVRVGDCFDDGAFASEDVSEVPGVPCSDPHDNEVYALFDLPPGDFPGDEQVDQQARLGCYERFEGAIGRSYEDSEIDYIAMYPTAESWTQINDREVVCIAFHMEYEKLTGSVLGSGR